MNRIFVCLFGCLFVLGCAHPYYATDNPAIGAKEINVAVDSSDVLPGDYLSVIQRGCNGKQTASSSTSVLRCSHHVSGRARILKYLDRERAAVSFQEDLAYTPDMYFQKISK